MVSRSLSASTCSWVISPFANSEPTAAPQSCRQSQKLIAAQKQIAEDSGGQAFTADQASELSAVYKKLGSEVAEKLQKREVTSAFAGGAAFILLLGGGLSLRWFRRLL